MKKEEVITMITSFTQQNRIDYAEKIYEIMENHLTPKNKKVEKEWRGEYNEFKRKNK